MPFEENWKDWRDAAPRPPLRGSKTSAALAASGADSAAGIGTGDGGATELYLPCVPSDWTDEAIHALHIDSRADPTSIIGIHLSNKRVAGGSTRSAIVRYRNHQAAARALELIKGQPASCPDGDYMSIRAQWAHKPSPSGDNRPGREPSRHGANESAGQSSSAGEPRRNEPARGSQAAQAPTAVPKGTRIWNWRTGRTGEVVYCDPRILARGSTGSGGLWVKFDDGEQGERDIAMFETLNGQPLAQASKPVVPVRAEKGIRVRNWKTGRVGTVSKVEHDGLLIWFDNGERGVQDAIEFEALDGRPLDVEAPSAQHGRGSNNQDSHGRGSNNQEWWDNSWKAPGASKGWGSPRDGGGGKGGGYNSKGSSSSWGGGWQEQAGSKGGSKGMQALGDAGRGWGGEQQRSPPRGNDGWRGHAEAPYRQEAASSRGSQGKWGGWVDRNDPHNDPDYRRDGYFGGSGGGGQKPGGERESKPTVGRSALGNWGNGGWNANDARQDPDYWRGSSYGGGGGGKGGQRGGHDNSAGSWGGSGWSSNKDNYWQGGHSSGYGNRERWAAPRGRYAPETTPEWPEQRWGAQQGQEHDDLAKRALKEVAQHVRRPENYGRVWIPNWPGRYQAVLGHLRDFLESHPDKFTVVPAEGRRYTVEFADGSAEPKPAAAQDGPRDSAKGKGKAKGGTKGKGAGYKAWKPKEPVAAEGDGEGNKSALLPSVGTWLMVKPPQAEQAADEGAKA